MNLERIETVEGRVDAHTNGDSSSLPISTLMRMTKDLKRRLRHLQKYLRKARNNPAWQFSSPEKDRAAVKRKIQLELRRKKQEVTGHFKSMDSVLSDLRERAEAFDLAREKRRAERQKQKAVRAAARNAKADAAARAKHEACAAQMELF